MSVQLGQRRNLFKRAAHIAWTTVPDEPAAAAAMIRWMDEVRSAGDPAGGL